MSTTMELSQESLDAIGSYVRRNFRSWFEETMQHDYHLRDIELRERTVRVEEELRAQRELMLRGFEQVEKQFKQVDKRFEQVDKRFSEQREEFNSRFEELDRHLNRSMTLITIVVTVIGAAGMLVNLVG